MNFFAGGVIGLFVGWWLVPQPQWAANIWIWIKSKFNRKTA